MNTKLTGFAKSYAENRQTFINTLSDIIGVKPDIFAEVLKSKTKNMYPNDYFAISEVALRITESDCVDFGHEKNNLITKWGVPHEETRPEWYWQMHSYITYFGQYLFCFDYLNLSFGAKVANVIFVIPGLLLIAVWGMHLILLITYAVYNIVFWSIILTCYSFSAAKRYLTNRFA